MSLEKTFSYFKAQGGAAWAYRRNNQRFRTQSCYVSQA